MPSDLLKTEQSQSTMRMNNSGHDSKLEIIQRLGGQHLYDMIVLDLCSRISCDPKLFKFYRTFNSKDLCVQQRRVLDTCFLDSGTEQRKAAESLIILYHFRLFQIGLGDRHFDRILDHLVESLRVAWADEDLIDVIISRYESMRGVFADATAACVRPPLTPTGLNNRRSSAVAAGHDVGGLPPLCRVKKDDVMSKTEHLPSRGHSNELMRPHHRSFLSRNNFFARFKDAKVLPKPSMSKQEDTQFL